MEIEHMREFTIFARHMNFSKAALAIGIAQPTLSSHIASMEMELGFKLVYRGKPLRITPAGKQFCVECERILATYEAAVAECSVLAKKRIGSLTFELPIAQGGISAVFDYLLLLFQKQYPTISVRRHDGTDQSLSAMLAEGLADVGIVLNPNIIASDGEDEGIEVIPLNVEARTPYYLWMDASHPLASKDRLTPQDLGGCRFLMPSSIRYQGLENLASLAESVYGIDVECVFWPGKYDECILRIDKSEVMIVNDDDLHDPAYHLVGNRVAVPLDEFEEIVKPCFVFLKSNENPALEALRAFLAEDPVS